ncbi:MAG TPA: hypothetical protein ENN18_05175 [Proteobacteria bacterium]|nr:hypothetical protein [Pseudomonadota bacterium]
MREPLRLQEMERLHIMNVLQRTEGHKTRAAQLLGIDRKTLRTKIKKYQIPANFPREYLDIEIEKSEGASEMNIVLTRVDKLVK